VKTLSARAAGAASASQLGDAGIRDGAPGRRRDVRVVALGGGTGLPVLLRGLKAVLFPAARAGSRARERERLTAIVTAADDGGSSGRLREAYQVLPPGDIRNCLLALADADPTVSAIFAYRFVGDGEHGVGGHSLGNLILAALSHLEHDFLAALDCATRMLAVRGRVLPATLEDVRLVAEFEDESSVEGESLISTVRRPIRRVYLRPGGAPALPEARRAIAAADLIFLGPGSLYTSIMPVLLVEGIAEAITASRARVVLVMNLMSEPGETDGYGPADFVRAIVRHAPRIAIHDVLVNVTPIPDDLIRRFAAAEARPIAADREALIALGCRPVERDLLGAPPHIRHDPSKLARAVVDLALEATAR
jgi:uncharacterized cofD-like protein